MNEIQAPAKARPTLALKILRTVVAALVIAVLAGAGFVGYAYVSSPQAIRKPAAEHFHLRLQMIVDGKDADFSSAAFQTPYAKDICTAALPTEPIHFHDGLGQFVHLHWAGMTGGLFLKNYGWNLVGGAAGTLGYRFDLLPKLVRIPIHGNALPARPVADNYYIYTGDANGYKQRNWDQFVSQNLEDFFAGKTSVRPSILNAFVGQAQAADAMEGMNMSAASKTEDERIKINHVVGNAVIFVQKDAPTDSQIAAKFANLVALPDSVCGG